MMNAARVNNALFWIGLIGWIAVLVSGALAAAHVFPTLKSEAMVLERFQAYPSQTHGLLAAGLIMEGLFTTVNLTQLALAPLVLATFAAQVCFFGMAWRRAGTWIRGLTLVAAAATLAWQALLLAPEMNRHLRRYWESAERGDLEAARLHQEAFDAGHPTAERLQGACLLLLITAAAASAAVMTPKAEGPT
jgi:hypothetical protein